jgi:hypothetical protein
VTEFLFLVEDAPNGGFIARGLSEAIFTEADTVNELHERVRAAVKCHFGEEDCPKVVRLHFERDEILDI